MKSIRNTTHNPLRVRLPKGKIMHLGPHQTGQISPHAVEHPPVQKLVEAGDIEIFDTADQAQAAKPGANPAVRQSHPASAQRHPTGDR